MDTEEILTLARNVVTAWDWTSDVSRPWPTRIDVRVTSMAELVPVVVGLRVKRLGYLAAIVGLDLGPAANELEVLYHFCKGEAVITLRVRLPREGATLPTLSEVIPGADIFERELSEMFGIRVCSPHNNAHLCLSEDWPDGVYPLRKDVALSSLRAADTPSVTFHFTEEDGVIVSAHLGLADNRWRVEKTAEADAWTENLCLPENICGICPQAHALAYSLALEQLHGVEASPRAQSIRVLAAELERIQSQLRWLAATAGEVGIGSLFARASRDSEIARSLLDRLGGGLVSLPGGVRCDVHPADMTSLREGLDILKERARTYLDLAHNDAIFQQHTRNFGVVTRAQAEVLGMVGPAVRASSVMRDVRVDAPYVAYRDHSLAVTLETHGDLEARIKMRVLELFESIDLARQVLETLPEGSLRSSLPETIPAGEAVVRVESPGGELFYFVKSNGSETPERVKIVTPGLRNLAAALRLTVGHKLAEVPVLLAGVEAGCPCDERLVKVHTGKDERILRWDELR